ncbi:MAG TPA: DNA/RNA nuclease SfsA [Candidatus Hydrogenedentes bacterium]|nr:DNA/RNA nuclease SfsA [Candidatus Hydrogenedentota bacterium]HOK90511.1 DNA/RNA nuclease SfsA [Candidatus Hydrogenedentota bacterium]
MTGETDPGGGELRRFEDSPTHSWSVVPPGWDMARARFLARPNRFVAHASLPEQGTVQAFLPNPGRLRELLLPGATLTLVRPARVVAGASSPDPGKRATDWTVVAVERDGAPVLLHTHWNNRVARHLLEHRLVPGLETYTVVRSEVRRGGSRFDFLLTGPDGPLLLEVKSCTLFESGVALFPDAPTDRGRRHVDELRAIARSGEAAAVLILAHSPRVTVFAPDYHTDPAFAQALCQARRDVTVIPVRLGWTSDLYLSGWPERLPVPWEVIERENRDGGVYVMGFRLDAPRTVEVGALGACRFNAGHYLYVGSAARGLDARIRRHLARRKRFHWHVDWLRDVADGVRAWPIRCVERLECALARSLSERLTEGPPGFGSSDCACGTHLFYSGTDPEGEEWFHAWLGGWRTRALRGAGGQNLPI